MTPDMFTPVLDFDPTGEGLHVDLERLVSSRLLIQGSSGAGKSYLMRYVLEQTHGKIQQFIIDPEGEFSTLREHFDYVVASAGGDGDVPAHPDSADLLCRQLVELEASAILDIYELDPEEREEFVGRFLHRLINMPRESWRPALVIVDEAHEFAPESGKPPSRRPMELLVSKGRKRGLCAIYATQRLSKLSKNASDLQNVLVGYTGLDVDVRRAGDILGFDKAQSQDLKKLRHEFFAYGPAFGSYAGAVGVERVKSGVVETHHPEPGELRAPTPPPRGRLAELVAELAAIPDRAEEEERTIEQLERRVAQLETELRVARHQAGISAEEAEEMARERARAALEAIRHRVRPHVEELYHALANGSAPAVDPPAAVDPPPVPAGSGAREILEKVYAGGYSGVDLAPRHERVLGALSRLEAMGVAQPNRSVLAAVASYSPKSSGFEKTLGHLHSQGLVEYPAGGEVSLTASGRAMAGDGGGPVTLQELHEAWFRILDPRHVRILEPLIACYPAALTRDELAERSEYSAKSSGFEKAVGRLRSFGVVTYPTRGEVAATDTLFPEGLR